MRVSWACGNTAQNIIRKPLYLESKFPAAFSNYYFWRLARYNVWLYLEYQFIRRYDNMGTYTWRGFCLGDHHRRKTEKIRFSFEQLKLVKNTRM